MPTTALSPDLKQAALRRAADQCECRHPLPTPGNCLSLHTYELDGAEPCPNLDSLRVLDVAQLDGEVVGSPPEQLVVLCARCRAARSS